MIRTSSKPCVLLVEDDIMVSMMLEDRLDVAGYRVIKAARLAKALDLARTESIDVAVLDVNLAGEQSFPVASILRERGIPFVFASGYGDDGIPPEHNNATVLQKPYDSKTLTDALSTLR